MADARSSPHGRAAEAFAQRVSEEYSDAVEAVSLFGSATRGETQGRASDVDLLVVLREDAVPSVEDELRDVAYDLELEYEVPLSLVVKTETEYERQRNRPFLQAVENDARTLYG